MKSTFKMKKGITLIALVVTIIVLLILAGVSISMLTGQNGILNRAQEAKEKTETANEDEQRKLAQAEALMNTEKTTYKGGTLPEGFAPTKIEGEDSIEDGLVITDGYGNEFVWVEVPKTTEVYPTAGLSIKDFTDNEYTKIENDLHTYTENYRNGTEYKDEFATDETEGWFENKEKYDNAKKKMLKSVYENNGFWVGRYEAGYEIGEGIRSYENDAYTEHSTTQKLVTKANAIPYNWVRKSQANVLARNIESGSYTSSLMFGVQWDLILKFIQNKNSNIEYSLKTDSKEIGNYYNSDLILNRGKFATRSELTKWYNFDSNEKSEIVKASKKISQSSNSNAILLTTGASEQTKLQNIYDLAGNVWEWTLEFSSNSSAPGVHRGGALNYNGNGAPASYRDLGNTLYSSNSVGFRVVIY